MTPSTVFHSVRPGSYTIHEGAKSTPATENYYRTAERVHFVIEALQNGPFVARGAMGPSVYTTPPFKLRDQVKGHDIYGWPPGAERLPNAPSVNLIVLGARQAEDGSGHVYFTLADDAFTSSTALWVRAMRPSADQRVFIASHKTFALFETDIFPPYSPQKYVNRLLALPTGFPTEASQAECRKIGQEICDSFFDGFQAMTTIHAQVARQSRGRICFAREIEHLWGGIGDWLS